MVLNRDHGGYVCHVHCNMVYLQAEHYTVLVEREVHMILLFSACAIFSEQEVYPEISMTVPEWGYANVEVQCTAVVQDHQDTVPDLLLQWNSDLDGPLSFEPPDADGNIFFTGLLSMGTHQISLVVEDTDGNETVLSKEIIIGPDNTPPSCSILSDEEFWLEESAVILQGQTNDPDIPVVLLKAEWHSDTDGSLGFGEVDESGLITLHMNEMSWNEHQVTLWVTDEVGEVCESTSVVRVGHVPNIDYCTDVLFWSDEWKAFEEEVVVRTNQIREQGTTCDGDVYPPVPSLKMQRNLRCSSRVHSKDMMERDYFAHENLSGEDPGTRMTNAEYPWMSYGENIAYGYASPAEVVDGWHQSPGHCRNMMSDWFDEIGVGIYSEAGGIYWTQNFGSR